MNYRWSLSGLQATTPSDPVYLSDGSYVFAALNSAATSVVVYRVSGHNTATQIATFAVAGQRPYLCVDSSDNIYGWGAQSSNGTYWYFFALANTGGPTGTWAVKGPWLSNASLAGVNSSVGRRGVWCNTGGGTNNKGHVVIGASMYLGQTFLASVDAGAMLAGTSTTSFVSSLAGPTGTNAYYGTAFPSQSSAWGTSGVGWISGDSGSTGRVFTWSITSAGALSYVDKYATDITNVNYPTVDLVQITSTQWLICGVYAPGGHSNTCYVQPITATAKGTQVSIQTGDTGASNLGFPAGVGSAYLYEYSAYGVAPAQTVSKVAATVGSNTVTLGSYAADDTAALPNTTTGNGMVVAANPPGAFVDYIVVGADGKLYGNATLWQQAPNAPTGLTPNGNTVDNSVIEQLGWTYSNGISSDTQSGFNLRWRHAGSSDAWNTVSQTTPNAYWNAPANTFPAEGIEWQVQTLDQGGFTSPWSALTTFTAAAPTATPTITAPVSGATIGLTPSTVSWSAPSQQAYQVRTVADDGSGNPNTGTVYTDTGAVVDTTTRSISVAYSTNNITVHTQVRVQSNTFWSSWADVRNPVSYTPPAAPTLATSVNTAAGTITVTPTNPAPSGGQPTVASIDIWCRTAASSTVADPKRPAGTGVRLAAAVAANSAWTDYCPASGVVYEYQVIANGSNTTTAASGWTA